MKTETTLNEHAHDVTIGSVPSKDGTIIGYRRIGRGPALIVVCGAMVSSKSHLRLAESLADAFTVYLPDRRGRGLSGARGSNYGMAREIEDLDALIRESGAQLVFGISAGALVCLRAALRPSEIRRIALYEPALIVDESAPTFATTRLERELTEGNVAAALVTGMKESRMGPPILNVIPRPLLARMTGWAMKSEEKKAGPDDVTMRMLAPALREDFQLINETKGALASFGRIDTDVLLLGGSKSPAYLRRASDALANVLPHATQVELAGLDHGGATERDGKPEVVADALRRFFM